MNPNKLAYTPSEAAAACGVSEDRIRRALKATDSTALPCRRPGGHLIIILASDLIAWLEALPSERAS